MWLEVMDKVFQQITPGLTIWGISIALLLQGFAWDSKKNTKGLGIFAIASGFLMFLVGLMAIIASINKLGGPIGILWVIIFGEIGLVIVMALFSRKQLTIR